MHFSDINNGSGSKLSKIGIVTALHLVAGIALVNNMNQHKPGPAQAPDTDIVFVKEKTVELPPPPPPPPPTQLQKPVTPPRPVIAPPPEVPMQQANTEPTVTATFDTTAVVADPGPPVVADARVEPAAKPATAAAMRTAVLADAAGCGKPDYPARAARNGETGTVALALLVGSDGKVADARIQKSSGSRELDRAAVAALSMCKFKPATNGGVPEQGWAQIAYVWTLET